MNTGDKLFVVISLLASFILAGLLVWNQMNKSIAVFYEESNLTELDENTQSERVEETEYEDENQGVLEYESISGIGNIPGIGSDRQKIDDKDKENLRTEEIPETEIEIEVEIEEEANAESEEEFLYYIRVNRALNCITVYGIDEFGEYTVPVKAMICSTGGATPLGTYGTKARYEMKGLNGGVYGQYSTWIMGNILFHSVPSSRKTKDSLIARYYNQLGTKASAGCIRLTVADAKWIYDNCPIGTLVEIYDDWEDEGPLGKPEAIKVPLDTVWDPTDPDEANPWNECEPKIDVGAVIQVYAGDELRIQDFARAYDTCGNDITDRLVVEGEFDLNREGKYRITVKVTDSLERTVWEEVVLVVQ